MRRAKREAGNAGGFQLITSIEMRDIWDHQASPKYHNGLQPGRTMPFLGKLGKYHLISLKNIA